MMKEKVTKHKITPAIQKQIYEVARTLPPMGKMVNGKPVYKEATVKGSELSVADLKPGTPLVADAMYKVNKLMYINHTMEMIRLVQRDGPGAIAIYQADCNSQLSMFKQEEKRKKSFINKLINKLPWIKNRK